MLNVMDNESSDGAGLRELALFAGAGGGILGGVLLGWRTVCAVEINGYAASVLVSRQNDGTLPPFPIWDDVRTFDGRPWYGVVDVISGGFPCQDISAAGKGAGIEGAKSGLWSEFARIISEVRPLYVFVENSPMLTRRGIHQILGDLAEMGFDAKWGVLGADNVGAPHIRKRIWIVANACSGRRGQQEGRKVEFARGAKIVSSGDAPNSISVRAKGLQEREESAFSQSGNLCESQGGDGRSRWWATEPGMGRVVNGLAHRVERVRALGNGQVSAVAKLAWETLCPKGA